MMPVITIEGVKMTREQKQKIVKELTASSSAIMNVPEQAFVVLVKENETDNVGVGGQLLSDK